jgi:drug/metabolite transporter (DMT)-like permease
MTPAIFTAVMAAALLHATWNALVKQGGSKMRAMAIMTLVQGGFGALIALGQPLPPSYVWGWLLASGLFHSAYKLFLGYAYEQGDLSRVYPIARGAAPMLVLAIGALVLRDRLLPAELLGIVVLGGGILMMARGAVFQQEARALVPLALGSAAMTAGYSIVDGMGARAWGNAMAYVAWLFVLDALFFTPIALRARGHGLLSGGSARDWGRGSLAAGASYGAYAVAVWAMTQAPIALVAALRETSILFAVLIGWLLLGERMDFGKASAALLILAGVVLTRI